MAQKKRIRFRVVGILETSTCLERRILSKEKIVEVRKFTNKTTKYCDFDSKIVVNGLN